MEYREFRADPVGVNDEGKLYGVAVPFGRETVIGDLERGGWHEEVAAGACKKSIKDGDVVFLAHHDMHMPLARMSAGNLSLREAQDKLHWEAEPVDTSYGRDIRKLADAKVLGGVSIGFQPVQDEWRDANGNPSDKYNGTHRVLREIKLIEISAVTNPAYKDTSIMARDELLAEREARAERNPEERAGSKKPYGDVPYADPKNGKYPIDKPHVKAAWAYINQVKNAAKYPLNGVTLKSVKDRIRKAMQKFGFTSGTAAAEAKSFEFASAEWRDDDPYFDDWYEIDELEDGDEADESKSAEPTNLVAAILASRSEPAIVQIIDYCISLRDDPDGKEYAAIDAALQMLRKAPPNIKGALATLRERQGQRDDPDGQEFQCIDHCIRLLEENPPDVKGAKNALSSNQMWRRDSDQEPETSTPSTEDEDLALRMAMRSREIELETT